MKNEKAEPNDTPNLEDEFKACPYCAELIRKKAVYCRYCGKVLGKMPGKTGAPASTSVKLRLKPVAMPVPAQTENVKNMKAWTPRPPHNWGGDLRMIVALLLIGFLAYYWYNKVRYERDVFAPWKTKFTRQVVPQLKTAGYNIEKRIKDLLENHLTKIEEQNLPEKPDTPSD